MADFKTHITGSTIVGIAYGYWGVTQQSMSLETGILAAGLCSVSGMLPDLDSDSGIPLRETSMFASAVIPILMLDRFREMQLSHESMVLATMLIYIGIRFVVVEFFRRFTVHRGMWHSLPAAATAGLAAYLVMPCPEESVRLFKTSAVVIGFLVHLVLDEIWAIEFGFLRFRAKKSFGSALKLFGNNQFANLMVYAQVAVLAYLAWGDHDLAGRIRERARFDDPHIAQPPPDSHSWERFSPLH
ncbi:MAG: metal-dependent hydrolase [Pirellulaceae bacterium]|nr:metal-dependent hydrolase [Pirellulaceae bacterium]